MSGQNGVDESARLEAALERIARAASAAAARPAPAPAPAPVPEAGLHAAPPSATTGPEVAEVTARLDTVIAHIRSALGPQGI